MDGTVRYDPATATLRVGNVEVTDPDVIAEAARWSTGERGEPVSPDDLAHVDLTQFVTEALSVGARVLTIASQASDTLAVQNAVRAASEQVDEATRRASDTLARTAHDAAATLADTVTRLLGGESPELLDRLRPVLARVGTDLEGQIAQAITKAHEALRLENDRRHGELAELVRGVEQRIVVQAAEAAATAQVREATTVKGFDYEARVNAAFATIATGLGDEYVETGDRAGRLPRNKKGDGVLTVNDGLARIVVEAHDGTSKDWGPYLAEAERNRGAVASIGCVKHVHDNQGKHVRVIGPRRIVVAYDPDVDDIEMLRTVTLLLRTVAVSTSGRFGSEEVATAAAAVREALARLDDLDEAKRSASAIAGHATRIEQTITKTVTTVQRDLHAAANALNGAPAAGVAATA